MSSEKQPTISSSRAIRMPSPTETHDVRVVEIAVMQKGQPLFSELTTRISLDDEAAGEFVKVMQEGGHTDIAKWIAIEPSEWPTLRDAIEYMVGQCRPS
jgi:hypothetical protein